MKIAAEIRVTNAEIARVLVMAVETEIGIIKVTREALTRARQMGQMKI